MDAFDSYYDENVLKKKNIDSGSQELLQEKREEIYKFFSNTMTLIVVVGLWVSFVYSMFTSISSLATGEAGFMTKLVSLLISFALGVIVPVGFYKLHSASKKKDSVVFESGLGWLITYFKIMKILLIVVAVISGIFLILPMILNPTGIFSLLVLGGIFALAFYIISIFRGFLEELILSFNGAYSPVALAEKIKTYLIVMLVISVIGIMIVVVVIEALQSNLPTGYGGEVQLLLDSLNTITIVSYISMAITVLTQIYFIWYVSEFNKTFIKFNFYFKKKVGEIKSNFKKIDEL